LPASLYPRVLGASWERLDEAVRCHHLQDDNLRSTGRFRIDYGSQCARLIGRLLGLPPAAGAVMTRLEIRVVEGGEEWRRVFGDRSLITTQFAAPNGQIIERLGALELRFRLEVADGGLVYHQTHTALLLGRWRLPIPRWFSPQVAAWERPGAAPNQVEVSVEVMLPILGPLIIYQGTMCAEEAKR